MCACAFFFLILVNHFKFNTSIMQSDHRVPTINTTAMRQQHRKRSYSNGNFRKRERNDLICVVCHASAMGYNFDQITCESCKAFFRRNALANANKLKCRTGTNDCIITLETRKRCKYCRLKKCFDKGLRKEWIMSEEEKRTKKQKIEENRRLRAMSQSLSMLTNASHLPADLFDENYSFENLYYTSDEDSDDFKNLLNQYDRILLNNIDEHYTQAVRLNTSVIQGVDTPCLRNMSDFVEIVNEPAHISALRLITFFKLTPEFNSLHEDDRLALVKHNVFTILYIHYCICTDIERDIFHEPNTPSDFCYNASDVRKYSDAIYFEAIQLVDRVQKLSSNDHLIMKLLILIVLFSKGSDPIEPILIESTKVFYVQNIFVNLLWNYITVRFGSDRTATLVSHLIFSSLKCQSLARETKEIIVKQTVQTDELAPLMQSVLQIS
jgi:succinate dehydrogenase flavin-adding protein (antitoxin of CptAB toxin-antitoxin module)